MTQQASRSVGGSVLTALAMAVAIFGAFLGSGAMGGTPIREASGGWLDTDSTLLSPAGTAFSIWSFIYVGLVVYTVWQFTPRARESALQHRARGWIIASALLNAAWIGVVQLGWLAASLAVILFLLLVLIRLFILLVKHRFETRTERWIMWVVFGVYLGWVNVATIANAAALLGSLGVGEAAAWTEPLAIALIIVAVLIGVATVLYSAGHIAVAVAMSWGLAWIGVSRLEMGNYSLPVAVTAFAGSALLLLGAVALMLRQRTAIKKARTRG